MSKLKRIGPLAALALLAVVLLTGIDPSAAPPDGLKKYFLRQGVLETGAVNLVTSVYLGYRAFDTLGESIVLVLSVTGVIAVLARKD